MITPRELALSAYDAPAREILVGAFGDCPEYDPIWIELYVRAIIQNDIDFSISGYKDQTKSDKIVFFNNLRKKAEQSRNVAIINAIELFKKSLKNGIEKGSRFFSIIKREAENLQYYRSSVRKEQEEFARVQLEITLRVYLVACAVLAVFLLYIGFKIGALGA